MLRVAEHTADDFRLQRHQGNLLKGHRQNKETGCREDTQRQGSSECDAGGKRLCDPVALFAWRQAMVRASPLRWELNTGMKNFQEASVLDAAGGGAAGSTGM